MPIDIVRVDIHCKLRVVQKSIVIMTIDINFVDASKLEIVKFDMLWIG
jgi:hypothetical protein